MATDNVVEVYQLHSQLDVSTAGDYFAGTMSADGFEVPIFDLKKIVKYKSEPDLEAFTKCVVIFTVDDFVFGVLVDRVNEVIEMSTQDILSSGFKPPVYGVGQHLFQCVQVLNASQLVPQVERLNFAKLHSKVAS